MAGNYETTTLRKKYHDAIVAWQEKNFPEMDLLIRGWDEHFPGQTRFALIAKVGHLKDENIQVGNFAGTPRFQRASDMRGNMFFTARDIIRAQCSTEFGSIQQHRMSLERAHTDEAKFAMLRVMAEELRHAYQVFWVLEHDSSWKRPGYGDVAEETIDELLAMETGQHVLDAFNIPFVSFLDNVVFTTVIDLVGKYQLDMQRVFSYAPLARSMGPMYSEEGFHIGSGKRFLKDLALQAADQRGDHSIADIQRSLNQWYPRGLEMFGNEEGGHTAVAFGFKDKTNGEAQNEYVDEVSSAIDHINSALITQVYRKGMDQDAARDLQLQIRTEREPAEGVSPEQILTLPSRRFFRRRGPADVVFRPFDTHGDILAENGNPYGATQYLGYLDRVLPDHYVRCAEFARYRDNLLEWERTGGGGMILPTGGYAG